LAAPVSTKIFGRLAPMHLGIEAGKKRLKNSYFFCYNSFRFFSVLLILEKYTDLFSHATGEDL
jgi:hypothetical protein